jgi:hypothetical protein
MPKQDNATLALNRGVLSDLGLARVDLARYRMAAEVMNNWMARVLGSMMLRPGWGYTGETANGNQSKTIPFIFGATDTARIEVTDLQARVWVDDALITRPAVATVVTNGSFAVDISGWTNNSDAGGTVTWVSAGAVSFVGTGGGNNAILDQAINVAAGDVNTRQALRIIVSSGPITFRCGTTLGDDSLISETTLNAGTHSLALTPGQATFFIRFENPNAAASILSSCNIEPAGVLSLPTPWLTGDLQSLRWAQSADVVFVGCLGYPQQQFERRAVDSWSIVDYTQTCTAGPFRTLNVTNIQLTPSATTGNISVASNKPFFKPGHVGALFRIISTGQGATNLLAAASQYSNAILVTGVGAQRQFAITITGVFVGTLSLQYSVGSSAGPWVDTGTTYTADTGTVFNDGNDNQSIYYRLGFNAGHYTSGSANVSISIGQGSITGIFRVTNYQNSQSVLAAVLEQLGTTTATPNWYEGAWSTFRGFPSCPVIWGGRLWWFGVSIFGSVSDNYNDFDDTITGGSAPIIGQFDSGPVENIYYAIGLQQLVVGNASQETSIRSDYLGDPVTITNFNVMTGSTQGSANVAAIQMDRSGIFVQVSGQRVFTLDLDIYTYSYKSTELTLLVPDFNSAGIVALAIQRKPDTRVHCVRTDGTVGIMVYDSTENVTCWLEVTPAPSSGGAGFVEDVTVLPGAGQSEDQVYYTVRRIINGQTLRFHEKWALEEDCTGLPLAKHLDAHIVFSSAQATTTITGLLPLAGETVSVWGWNTLNPFIDASGNTAGLDLGTYVVSSLGTIVGVNQAGTAFPLTNAIVGLAYTAQWKSMKQSFAAALGTPLNQPKRISRLGLVLQNTHAQGIKAGNDFDHLDDIPQDDLPRDAEDNVDLNAILNNYDKQMAAFNDRWSTDSRVCLQAASPRPCTCLAFTTEMSTDG